MNIVTLLFAIVTIAAVVALLILVKAVAEEYRADNQHERKIEQKEIETQKSIFESEDLNKDPIDRELEKERNKNN